MSNTEIDVVQQLDSIKRDLLTEESTNKVVNITPEEESEAVEINKSENKVNIVTEDTEAVNGLSEEKNLEETVKVVDPTAYENLVNIEAVENNFSGQSPETVTDENIENVQDEELVEDVNVENRQENNQETVNIVTPETTESTESVIVINENEPSEESVIVETPSQQGNEDVVVIGHENGEQITIVDLTLEKSEQPQEVIEDKVLIVEPSKYGIFKPKIKIAMPKLKLLNGETMPVFGLGTWQSAPEDVSLAVRAAIDFGYRHLDCAYVYKNEEAVGEAIAAKIAEGVVKREELFVCTKLWNTDHEPQDVEKACRRSLELLGLEYLDLYLMHTPMGFKSGSQLLPKIAGVIQYSSVDYLDTWYAMEKLVSAGLTKSIGVSNFNIAQLERLWNKAKIKPVTNQVECHPFLNQQKISSWCAINGVILTAYSSLGSGSPTSNSETTEVLIENNLVKDIAKKYGRSPAQVLLRYQIDRGHATIPKSVTPSRIQENIGALEFQLKPEDIYSLNQLNKNKRYVPFVGFGDTHKDYPFNLPN